MRAGGCVRKTQFLETPCLQFSFYSTGRLSSVGTSLLLPYHEAERLSALCHRLLNHEAFLSWDPEHRPPRSISPTVSFIKLRLGLAATEARRLGSIANPIYRCSACKKRRRVEVG